MSLKGRVVLVTGASSGIGAATVRALAADGAEVHAAARRANRLETLAVETGCRPRVADLMNGAARARLIDAVCPEILVCNAGLGAGISGLEDAELADLEATIGTNVTAVLDLIRLALPHLKAARGHIVLLGSVAGLYPINSAVYGASKGAVRQISRNLRIELRGTGVRVTDVQPGRVATEFYDAAVADADVRDRLKTTGIRELDAADVAAAILYALSAPTHVNVSAIELQPTEQSFGGVSFDPVAD